jgi:pyruvate-formate lyase-activating enzyme
MSDTFCPLPWVYQAFRNNGDIRVCCQANQSPNRGILIREDGTTFNAATANLDESRNSELMKRLRKNMIAGEWSPECKRCRVEESNGLTSNRHYAIADWEMSLDDVINDTNNDGTIDIKKFPVISYDMRFGNLCNLVCRMCGPTDSHSWYEQWASYTGKDSFNDTHGKVQLIRNSVGRLATSDYDWHDSENFWTQIENNLDNIRHVYMAGGEPLMIERHYEFLQKCVDRDVAKNIKLEYNTNGTTLPKRALELWKKFKQVELGVSIDGFGKVVEYQRWPAKWSQLYPNLQKLNKLVETQSNIKCWLTVTVTAYNALHIAEFVEWKIFESGLDSIKSNRPIISHHVAHRPLSLNVRVLPPEIKIEIENRYKESIIKLNESGIDSKLIDRANDIYNGILTYMNQENLHETQFEEFVAYTKFLDKERNQNIVDIVPSLEKYFL